MALCLNASKEVRSVDLDGLAGRALSARNQQTSRGNLSQLCRGAPGSYRRVSRLSVVTERGYSRSLGNGRRQVAGTWQGKGLDPRRRATTRSCREAAVGEEKDVVPIVVWC